MEPRIEIDSRNERAWVYRYLMSLLLPGAATCVMLFSWPLLDANSVSLYLLAVMFCAWYGGLGPGLMSVVISFLLTDYFFIAPYFSLAVQNHHDLIRLLVLGFVGTVMSGLSKLMRKEQRRAQTNLEAAKLAEDATERKHADEALLEAERKYRDIFENAGEGIFQTTPEGQYLSGNPSLAYMHGFDSPEELIRNRRDITREIYVDPTLRGEFKRLMEQDA